MVGDDDWYWQPTKRQSITLATLQTAPIAVLTFWSIWPLTEPFQFHKVAAAMLAGTFLGASLVLFAGLQWREETNGE